MKTCYSRIIRPLNTIKNWINVVFGSLILICYCCHGDEGRPLSAASGPPLLCRVIFVDPFQRYVPFACSCKCRIWCQGTERCTKWHSFLHGNISTSTFRYLPSSSSLQGITINTFHSCCKNHSADLSFGNLLEEVDLKCIHSIYNASSECSVSGNDSCCSVVCTDHLNNCVCSSLPPSLIVDKLPVTSHRKRLHSSSADQETNGVARSRRKRNSLRLSASSPSRQDVRSWDSSPVTGVRLRLVPSGRTFPTNSFENLTLSPAAGAVFWDETSEAAADENLLKKYTWEGSISLYYEDIYPGFVQGTTTKAITDGSNEVLFDDLVISSWGYSYILRIQMRAVGTDEFDLTCEVGPFDVASVAEFEIPIVETDESRKVRMVFDGEYSAVQHDERKFAIFYLNYFGRKYPDVKWKVIRVSNGSVIVEAEIAGRTSDLDRTTAALTDAIASGRADIQYLKGQVWKASQVSSPSRKLLEESGSTEGQSLDDGGSGLSPAWIVAIVINVVLIVVFILAILYCWIRKKRLEDENVEDPQGYPTPSPPPTYPTPEPSPDPDEDFWASEQRTPEAEEEFDLPGSVIEPGPEIPREERYYVYLLTNADGSRELLGPLYLRVDAMLIDVRREIEKTRNLSEFIRKREYKFLNERYDVIQNYQEHSMDLEGTYPAQEINIQYLQPKVENMPKIPAYVGPLGICSASDCTKAAKIKCLDCRNTAYCSKRCMREDVKDHRRACYKPAWRL